LKISIGGRRVKACTVTVIPEVRDVIRTGRCLQPSKNAHAATPSSDRVDCSMDEQGIDVQAIYQLLVRRRSRTARQIIKIQTKAGGVVRAASDRFVGLASVASNRLSSSSTR
jgi:hypothetical protein